MNKILKSSLNLITNHFVKSFFLISAALIFIPCQGFGVINVDGTLDEPEWENAQRFKDFVVIDPLTMEKPGLSTEALVISAPEGLLVGFICEQPNNENRIRTVTKRDSTDFEADSITLMIDFNGDGQIAYEFSVSISNSYRDGTVVYEGYASYSYTWDGEWKHAVNEDQDRWTVEILLPWSIATMKGGSGEKRNIGMCFQRQLQSTKEKYSFPAVSAARTQFITEFSRVEIAKYSSQELTVTPYATALRDLLKDTTDGKAGLDILWKPNQNIHLLATVKPDFGTVESDDLVIDFSAIETRYTDKRPFFTEDQRIFDDQMFMDNIFYTRRVGGASDKDGMPSDIEAAVKVIGSTEKVNFGAFAAHEADDAGRSFYAGRVSLLGKTLSVGALSTYTERPFLDRTALVNTIDYDLSLFDSMRSVGHLMGSRIRTGDGSSNGCGFWNEIRYAVEDRWLYILTAQHYDKKLDLNDMGYLNRNNYDSLWADARYSRTDFPGDSRTASVLWAFGSVFERNTDGFRLPVTIHFARNEKMRSGSMLNAEVVYNTGGYDDLISRQNGMVRLNKRWNGTVSYNTQRRRMWSKSFSLKVFQEGIRGWAVGLTSDVTWYPNEKLNINLSLNPQRSGDWLKWVRDKQLGSFSKDQVTGTVGVNWFPADRHEIRLRSQWFTVNAKAEQSYYIGDNGRLVADNAVMRDFAATSFAFQLRYRYELASMSDLYICYSRGGSDYLEDQEQGTLGLLGDSTKLRDSDQILVKLSYRFKVI